MSAWKGRPVLLTGGTGFLGAHIAEALLAAGAEVVALVRDEVPRARFFDEGIARRCVLVRGAVEDFALVERTLNEYGIEAVLHLAAQTIVEKANRSPMGTFESNIKGTWTILEAVRLHAERVKAVVVASSDKAYGAADRLPYNEETPLRGRHPYDVSKSCADLIARAYAETFGLPVGVTRCGNLFGEGDLNFDRLVPGAIRAFLRGEEFLVRSDGTFVRDYLYVKDAAEAVLLYGAHLLGGGREPALNFSLGEPLSVLAMIDRIARAFGAPTKAPRILATAQAEIKEQYLDSTRARAVLGWRPTYGLDEGLKRTVAWYRTRVG